jgi:hypothetical protein
MNQFFKNTQTSVIAESSYIDTYDVEGKMSRKNQNIVTLNNKVYGLVTLLWPRRNYFVVVLFQFMCGRKTHFPLQENSFFFNSKNILKGVRPKE